MRYIALEELGLDSTWLGYEVAGIWYPSAAEKAAVSPKVAGGAAMALVRMSGGVAEWPHYEGVSHRTVTCARHLCRALTMLSGGLLSEQVGHALGAYGGTQQQCE